MKKQADPSDFVKNIQDTYLEYIDKLLDSGLIRRSKNTCRVLRYYRQKILEKDVHHISEKVIAYEVFGKNTDYDPTVDSFVRVMFHRFRNTLQEYYLFEGDADHFELYFPKGTYVPHFRRRFIVGRVKTDLPFILSRNRLEEKVIGSLRSLFMLSITKEHQKLVMDYYASLDEKLRSPYIKAVFLEMQIMGRIVFRDITVIDENQLAEEIFRLHNEHKEEEHTFLPLLMHLLSAQKYEECVKTSEQLFESTRDSYYKGMACICLASITSKENLLIELQYISDISNHISIFWKLPRVVYFLRNKDIEQAMHEVNDAAQYQNIITRVLQLVIKNKIARLSREDRQFVFENKDFFTVEYLRNFIFELAREYAILSV